MEPPPANSNARTKEMINLVDIIKPPSKNRLIFIGILTILAYFCNEILFQSIAYAADEVNPSILIRIYNKFNNIGFALGNEIKKYATWLLGWILLAQFILIGIKGVLSQDDFKEIIARMGKVCLWAGLFLFLIFMSGDYIDLLVNGFHNTAVKVGEQSGTFAKANISDLLKLGFNLSIRSFSSASLGNPVDAAVFILSGFGILLCFGFIVGMGVIIKCEAFLALNIGVFILGFGGNEYTRPFASNYLRYALGIGLKIFSIEVLFGVSWAFLQDFANIEFGDIKEPIVILVCVFIMAFLVKVLPDSLSNMVTNYAGSSGGAMAGAMAAMVGMAMAGAKGATNAPEAIDKLSGAVSGIEETKKAAGLADAESNN